MLTLIFFLNRPPLFWMGDRQRIHLNSSLHDVGIGSWRDFHNSSAIYVFFVRVFDSSSFVFYDSRKHVSPSTYTCIKACEKGRTFNSYGMLWFCIWTCATLCSSSNWWVSYSHLHILLGLNMYLSTKQEFIIVSSSSLYLKFNKFTIFHIQLQYLLTHVKFKFCWLMLTLKNCWLKITLKKFLLTHRLQSLLSTIYYFFGTQTTKH